MRTSTVATSLALLVMGCSGQAIDAEAVGQSVSAGTGDEGTRLTAHADAPSVVCSTDGGGATVTLGGTLTSTGSVNSAVITASVDGDAEAEVGVILPQDFVHSGRNKVASWSFDLELANGEHSVEVCFTQSGAQGRTPKRVCTTVAVVVSCDVVECDIGACVSACHQACNDAACNQCCECVCKSTTAGCTPQDLCYTGSHGHAICL